MELQASVSSWCLTRVAAGREGAGELQVDHQCLLCPSLGGDTVGVKPRRTWGLYFRRHFGKNVVNTLQGSRLKEETAVI